MWRYRKTEKETVRFKCKMKQAQQSVSKLFVDSEKRLKVIMNKCYGCVDPVTLRDFT